MPDFRPPRDQTRLDPRLPGFVQPQDYSYLPKSVDELFASIRRGRELKAARERQSAIDLASTGVDWNAATPEDVRAVMEGRGGVDGLKEYIEREKAKRGRSARREEAEIADIEARAGARAPAGGKAVAAQTAQAKLDKIRADIARTMFEIGPKAKNVPSAPAGYKWLEPGKTLAVIPGGPADVKETARKEKDVKAAAVREKSVRTAAATVVQDLNRGISILDKNMKRLGPTTAAGPLATVLKLIPSTDAHTLKRFAESALSNVSLDRLQQMREASPTGGGLGQVPVKQQEYLMQVLGSLDVEQKPQILLDNMKRIVNIYNDIIHGEGNGPKRYRLSFDQSGLPQRGEWQGVSSFLPEDSGSEEIEVPLKSGKVAIVKDGKFLRYK